MSYVLMTSSTAFWVGYLIFIVALVYFMGIRPQKKQKKAFEELMASMEIGDSVKTTAGFYGEEFDITDDMVNVEFGCIKNCRIPIDKTSIVEIEKSNAPAAE